MGKSPDELATYIRSLYFEFVERCEAAGVPVVTEDTGRTVQEQVVKLSQGVSRTTNSRHLPQPPEWKSEAFDVVPKICLPLKYWGWNGSLGTSHPAWKQIIDIGLGLGLNNGYQMWGWDPGHFQWKRPNGNTVNQVVST
jgi:hypothetical protein